LKIRLLEVVTKVLLGHVAVRLGSIR